ncbi:MAG: mannose-1-phosphate guanylyltransferase, partial [Patescibacteria group bacterium]
MPITKLKQAIFPKKQPEYMKHAFGVILAGGGGTRLWPKSRGKTPKQFLKLTSDKTMIQITADRVSKVVDWSKIIVVTNKLHKDAVIKQLPKIKKENIIAEPEKKDTALAMLVGSLYAKSKDRDAVVLNAASDHVVPNENEYIRVMRAASKVAFRKKQLVTVGITPTHPHTGLGYIKISDDIERIGKGLSLFNVESFTEKPNQSTAKGFISTGKYYWNANMYVWSAQTIQDAFEKHMPKMHKLTKDLSSLSNKKFHNSLNNIYKKAEAISIDYAISEKADNLVLIPGDFG